MKKQHAISEQYFERLGRFGQVFLNYIEARQKRKLVRAYYLGAGELSPHIRKDIGLSDERNYHQ
ncbi:hypothetical protein [Maritalea sp.]|uniref:hypothetical protein n=1 Tax=Maritalea sp. TaxID=2003361 RepID=UPI003EF34AB9